MLTAAKSRLLRLYSRAYAWLTDGDDVPAWLLAAVCASGLLIGSVVRLIGGW